MSRSAKWFIQLKKTPGIILQVTVILLIDSINFSFRGRWCEKWAQEELCKSENNNKIVVKWNITDSSESSPPPLLWLSSVPWPELVTGRSWWMFQLTRFSKVAFAVAESQSSTSTVSVLPVCIHVCKAFKNWKFYFITAINKVLFEDDTLSPPVPSHDYLFLQHKLLFSNTQYSHVVNQKNICYNTCNIHIWHKFTCLGHQEVHQVRHQNKS